ncbi:MAG TPA: hypothetical protein PKD01_01505 [Mesorhizobium sp.]|nr:hypothetical protein [Mesorhizobium sp.]
MRRLDTIHTDVANNAACNADVSPLVIRPAAAMAAAVTAPAAPLQVANASAAAATPVRSSRRLVFGWMHISVRHRLLSLPPECPLPVSASCRPSAVCVANRFRIYPVSLSIFADAPAHLSCLQPFAHPFQGGKSA